LAKQQFAQVSSRHVLASYIDQASASKVDLLYNLSQVYPV